MENNNARCCFHTSSGPETGTTVELGDGGVLDGARGDGEGLGAASIAFAFTEDALQRSYSTSSIEDVLRQSQKTVLPVERLEPLAHKSRSSSCDDLAALSGSLTQTRSPTRTQFRP